MARFVLVGASLAILIASCGGSTTADEYVEDLNELVAVGRSDFEAAGAEYDRLDAPGLEGEVTFLAQEVAIRREFLKGLDALDPPESIAELHDLLRDAFVRLTEAAEGLAASAGTANSMAEVEQTPEFAEYLAANDDGARVCLIVQAQLDSLTASGQAFADEPWLSDLGLAVRGVLGCGEIEPDQTAP